MRVQKQKHIFETEGRHKQNSSEKFSLHKVKERNLAATSMRTFIIAVNMD